MRATLELNQHRIQLANNGRGKYTTYWPDEELSGLAQVSDAFHNLNNTF